MGAENITLGLALVAGFLSFISPCVLPLVPAYIGYMGGRMTRTVAVSAEAGGGQTKSKRTDAAARANMFLHGVAFVLGFTLVFVLIGLATTALVSVVGGTINVVTDIIGRVGGVMIIVFGLHFMGVLSRFFTWLRGQKSLLSTPVFTIGVGLALSLLILWGFVDIIIGLPLIAGLWLVLIIGGGMSTPGAFWSGILSRIELAFYSDTRRDIELNGRRGLVGSFFMGVVFSAGWTPCIGPLLGTILTLAANTGDVSQAVPLLTAYSLGLGIPFVVTALLLDRAQGILQRLQRHMHKIEVASGALLVAVGVLVASGQLAVLTNTLNNQFADFSARVEECGIGFFEGEVGVSYLGSCIGGTLHPVVLNQSALVNFQESGAQQEYLINLHDDQDVTAIDVEVLRPNKDFSARYELISGADADGERDVLASSTALTLVDPEDEAYIALRNIALEPGAYVLRVTYTGETIEDISERVRFRVKIVAARPESAMPATQDVSGQTASGSAVSGLADESANNAAEASDDAQSSTQDDAIGSITGLASQSGPAIGLDVGNRAPNFSVTTLAGETVSLRELEGQVVLLNFWGTWCGPCRREMPEFQDIYEDLSGEGFTILALAVRDTEDAMREFRDELGLTFPLALDVDDAISAEYAIPGQPSSFILDANGVIQFKSFTIVTQGQIEPILDEALATVG